MDTLIWFYLFAGANALILVVLASIVSWRRISLRIPHGDGDNKLMKQAIRAHANGTEHVPIMGLVVLGLCLAEAGATLIAALVVAFTASRVLHAVGMMSRFFNARRLGATVCYLSEIVAAVALLVQLGS